MIRFGIIGTGFITDHFIHSAQKTAQFKLSAIYSRSIEKAKSYGEKYSEELKYFDDLEAMALSDDIDAIYIASPNALHAPQSKLFLNHGKHVLVEKAAASNKRELEEVITLAKEKNLVYMEAMKSLTMPAFLALKETLPKIGKVRKYIGNYCQYSSRYDRHKNGEYVNTFHKEFSNGSLLDIGIYCIYPLVALFGAPLSIKANGIILENGGIDGCGSILMGYSDMEAIITHSKISNSYIPSEIQGELGNILIDKIGNPTELTLILRDGTREVIKPDTIPEDMVYEIEEFISLIQAQKIESSTNNFDLALSVHHIMDEVRKQIGLVYPSDLL
ncbi:MAG: Gfo/Idh/MocA family oxidoreductase [Clostridiaceae bacterium]